MTPDQDRRPTLARIKSVLEAENRFSIQHPRHTASASQQYGWANKDMADGVTEGNIDTSQHALRKINDAIHETAVKQHII